MGLDLERLVRIVEASKIDGLEIRGGFKDLFHMVKIEKRCGAPVISCYLPPPPKKKEIDRERRKMKYSEIKSPGVGIFYLIDPRIPNAEPYVKKGSKVKNGDVIGVINHYGNLYTEIVSPFNGRVRELYFSNKQVIDFGKSLIKMRVKN